MRKYLYLIFICVQLFIINTNTVYGEYSEKKLYTTDNIVFINNAPMKAYSYVSTKPYSSLFVYAEDLKKYGFDVTWKGNVLTIKRIPGKQPDELTPEEYKELTIRDKFGEPIPGFYYNTDIDLFLEGNEVLPTSLSGVISSNKGPLLSAYDLSKYYGSYKWKTVEDLNGNIIEDSTGYPIQDLYITIEYDYAICRTSLTNKRFRTTEPLDSYIKSKGNIDKKSSQDLFSVMHDKTVKGERFYFNIWVLENIPEGKKSIYARYIELEILEDFGLNYEFTDNTLEIPFGQSVKKEDIRHLFDKDVTCYEHINPVSMSCVDLKLLSNGKEIGKEDVFPPIINRGGGLYIKLQSLAEIVKVDGKSEKLGILEESEIIRKETDLEILEEAKLDIVSEISKWNEVKKKVETKIVKPVVEGSVIFGVGVLCLKSEILSKG